MMWEIWMYKTLMAFLSLQILQIVFGKYLKKLLKKYNAHGAGFIKGTINSLLVSMIPFFRWVFVSIIVIGIFMGASIQDE